MSEAVIEGKYSGIFNASYVQGDDLEKFGEEIGWKSEAGRDCIDTGNVCGKESEIDWREYVLCKGVTYCELCFKEDTKGIGFKYGTDAGSFSIGRKIDSPSFNGAVWIGADNDEDWTGFDTGVNACVNEEIGVRWKHGNW